ncbi:PUA domain-containing protein [Streptomyces sp. NPDC056437]|uniref:PUA domain-containing protein n=1 Tax=Streptomyces sp. NPDC056437 TaxID=3345816 RepID=UPI0036B6469E
MPAGIAAVEGEFSAGDPVELRDGEGRAVARREREQAPQGPSRRGGGGGRGRTPCRP